MIRFKEFLNEQPQDFDLEKFKEDCAYYFEQVKGTAKCLIHGDRTAPKEWTIAEFKARTGPAESPRPLHDKTNELFEKMFGFPFRNGLFTTSEGWLASMYGGGQTSAIFPIGKFEWLCNVDPKFDDFTTLHSTIRDQVKRGNPEFTIAQIDEEAIWQTLYEVKHSKDWKHNVDLVECLDSENEIMIKCGQFYKINRESDLFHDVIKPFLENK